MADDNRNIQCLARRNSGQIADGKDRTLGQIAQKMGYSEQKNAQRKPLLLEKTAGIGQKCR